MKTGIKTFDVLDRDLNIDQNFFLEASAGTGKTFSIENIVVRLLLSEKSLQLDQILVVTFTRAATRDLRVRIRSSIKGILQSFRTKNSSLDYVCAILEKGDDAIALAEKKLKQALLSYDQANIFTIHQFCYRMLSDFIFEGNYALDGASEDSPLPASYILMIIRDYFRTEVRSEIFSAQQLSLLLKKHENSIENLEKKLLEAVTKGIDISETPSYSEQYHQFVKIMQKLCHERGISGEKIRSDFKKLAPCFKDICDRQRRIKDEVMQKVEKFSELFDYENWSTDCFERLIEDKLFLVDALDPKNISKKGMPPDSELCIPNLREILKESFQSFVSPELIFAHMALGCRRLLKRHLDEEEILGFDELLEAARAAVQNPKFVDAVRSKFRCAIIDEFQDTDNQQWEIFQKLFISTNEKWGNLYLVGDPKQSIYAFRQADIYTYIEAGKVLGEEHHATLDTNYRSQPSLIEALNTLFNERSCPGFIGLPKIQGCLDYKEVESPLGAKEKQFSDDLKSINFCIAENLEAKSFPIENLEEKYFFPYIVQEIQRLKLRDGFTFNQFAILISDRFQGQRAAEYLAQWNIPSMTQRSSSIAESEAYLAFRNLLKGVLSPNHESSLKTALGTRLIGWTHDQVRKLEELDLLQDVLTRFYSMRRGLFEDGISSFFYSFMNEIWGINRKTVREELLMQEGGGEFYQDLLSVLEIVLDEQSRYSLSPIDLLKFMDDLKQLTENEDERLKKALDTTQDAVNILTIHSSKGLEFDIVFALGLIKQTISIDPFIPIVKEGKRVLTPVLDCEDPLFVEYCREVDAEKMRQLYVALTRAKYRLYCPVGIVPLNKIDEIGTASPMQLFLARLNQEKVNDDELYPRIQGYDGSLLREFIQKNPENITYTNLNDCNFSLVKEASTSTPEIFSPNVFSPPGSPIYIHSFTSLTKHETHVSSFSGAPRDFESRVKNPHTLPSGSETGNLLHLILENYRFGASVEEAVRPYVEFSQYRDWVSAICEILSNVSQTPFSSGFTLSDIDPEKCFRETEFLYCYDSHYLKGIIDLVFEHEGKYYIVDWKSNWLGPDQTYYSQDKLAVAMEENNYFFQAKLYKDALQKFLRIVDDREFEAVFGGSYYLFLRGLSPKSEENFGVYKCQE